jgi:hypothetical protein
MIAQLPSLTNDFPMYILGCFGLLSASSILQKSTSKGLVSFIIVALLFMAVKGFDVSSLSFLPFLCFLFLLLLVRSKPFFRQDFNPPYASLRFKAFLDFLGLFLCIIVFVCIIIFLLKIPAIANMLLLFDEQSNLLHDIQKINFYKYVAILVAYWKSLIGSFVWGHSYWPDALYMLSIVAYLVASYSGLLLLKSRTTSWCFYAVTILLGAVVALQITIILGIASNASFFENQIARDSFAKVRLSAPIATAALILASLSGTYITRSAGGAKFLRLWMIILFLSYALLLPTKFFFAEVF